MGSFSQFRLEFVRVLRARFLAAPLALLVSAAAQTTKQSDRAVTGRQTRLQKQAREESENNPPEARYRGTLQRARATREQSNNAVTVLLKTNSFHYSSTAILLHSLIE